MPNQEVLWWAGESAGSIAINGRCFQIEYNNQMLTTSSSHKKYARISSEKRSKLINRVLEQGISVVKASKKLGIKISTAKLILKKYKETGAIFHKKMPNYKRKDTRELSLSPQEPSSEEVKMSGIYMGPGEGGCEKQETGEGTMGSEQSTVGVYWLWPICYYSL